MKRPRAKIIRCGYASRRIAPAALFLFFLCLGLAYAGTEARTGDPASADNPAEKNGRRPFQYDKQYFEDKTLTRFKLKVQAAPTIIKPGGTAEIRVTVLTRKRRLPVGNAEVTITADGGFFNGTKARTIKGVSDDHGVFEARWTNDAPLDRIEKVKCGFSAQVSKPGYQTAKGRGIVRIQTQ